MKDKEIKKNINSLMTKMISSDFSDVISKNKKRKGVIVKMENKKKATNTFKGVSWALAAALVVVMGYVGVTYYGNNKIMATVDIDVNPSVELKINSNSKVISVDAENEDGKKIIGDMDLKGASLEVATNALIGSMLKLGYVSELKNSILVSVEGNDNTNNEALKNDLVAKIDSLLSTYNIDGSVISQVIVTDSELESLAEQHSITVGKVKLVNKILAKNDLYSFEELAKLPVNELNLLLNSKVNAVENVDVKGTASEKEYIGKEKAKSIALTHAKTTASKVVGLEAELDLENGIMVYDVEFDLGKKEYDYEINATTGVIIRSDIDEDYDDDNDDDDDNKTSNDTSNNSDNAKYISRTKAKEIALKHSKVSNPRDLDVEFEYRSGIAVYEVEFETTDKEYDYVINATSGNIIKSYVENDNEDNDDDDDDDDDEEDDSSSSSNSSTTGNTYIGRAKAKSIALKHAGISKYSDFDSDFETRNGIKVYDISFETTTYEYEYIINAKTGKIINSHKERQDVDDDIDDDNDDDDDDDDDDEDDDEDDD